MCKFLGACACDVRVFRTRTRFGGTSLARKVNSARDASEDCAEGSCRSSVLFSGGGETRDRREVEAMSSTQRAEALFDFEPTAEVELKMQVGT